MDAVVPHGIRRLVAFMKSWNASISGISAISAVVFDPPGSRKVRRVIPMGPNTSSRFGELSHAQHRPLRG